MAQQSRSNPPSPAAAWLILLALVMAAGVFYFLHSGPSPAHVPDAANEDAISVYFSPRGGCTAAIVEQISKATQSLDVMAYSFTSPEIAQSMCDAQSRGVKVRAILDLKENEPGKYSPATATLLEHHIPTWTDGQHSIAHNKVMIIDARTIITGSFNFTRQAEHSNAENLLILAGRKKLAAAYEANFQHHLEHSQPLHAPPG